MLILDIYIQNLVYILSTKRANLYIDYRVKSAMLILNYAISDIPRVLATY
jgi:hypothetical protein